MTKVFKLPGLVDVHVHLREPGATHKEDFTTGTKAAIAGGYTTVFDMPNNPNPTVTEDALEEKINLAKGRIYADLGFNFGGSKVSVPYFDKVKDRVFGLKVYMNHTTGPLLIEDQEDLEEIFANWPGGRRGKVIMVHAEGDTLVKAIDLAKRHGKRLHVCHISLEREIELIKKAKEEELDLTCEVSAHHLFLTDEDVKDLGPFGMMKPPLATKADVESLWVNLEFIDMVASDHAPHTVDEKIHAQIAPYGVPGLETTLPLLLDAANKGRVSLDKVIELTCKNPRKLFNLKDDKETFTEVDLDKEYEIKNENLFTKCGWTPFNGRVVRGKVKRVVLRGEEVYDGEKVLGPVGKVIYPQ